MAAATVYVISENPFLQFQANLAADGTFSFADVPTGRFRVKVTPFFSQSESLPRAGSFYGTIAQHGQTVTADVHMTDIFLGANLSDANEFRYTIDRGGTASGNLPGSSAFLQVGPGSNVESFLGDTMAPPSLGDRQISIPNTDRFDGGFPALLGGAVATRRIYVPPSGYFVRYLDVLENPGASPLTVTVRLSEFLQSSFGLQVAATSSGDQTLTTADRWFVMRDTSQTFLLPSALVFQGAGAAQPLEEPATAISVDRPFVGWKNVTIAPGGRVIFLHFVLAQSNVAGAQAAAERLAQLPPEALDGIPAADRALIRNFVVPADGSSNLPAFGTVTGRVLTAAGTPVANAIVLVGGSVAPFYKTAIAVQADADGHYVANTLDEGPFTVQAKDPVTSLTTPVVSLTLGVGQSTVNQDLAFSASGSLRGTVRFAAGGPVTNGNVRITGGVPAVDITLPLGGDGAYALNVLPAGTYTASANANYPTFRFNTVSGIVVASGAVTVADITMRALVDARITITNSNGAPVPSVYLFLADGLFSHPAVITDANGTATIGSVGDGVFSLQVYGLSGSLLGNFTGTVQVADDGRTVDFGYTLATAGISGTVRLANGTPASSGFVQISPDGFNTVASANIAANGTYTVSAINPGSYMVFATVAGSTISSPFVTVTAGLPTIVDLKFPAIATVRLTARLTNGTVLAGYPVVIVDDVDGRRNVGSTNASGQVVVAAVPEGPFFLYVYKPGFAALVGSVEGEVRAADHGTTIDAVFEVAGGSISGHVYARDGATTLPDIYVELWDAQSGAFVTYTFSDADGLYRFDIVTVPSGQFKLIAYSPAGSTVEALGTLANAVVVDLILPVATMNGTVVYADGSPAADASISVAQLSLGGGVEQSSVRAAADGTFTALVRTGEIEGTRPRSAVHAGSAGFRRRHRSIGAGAPPDPAADRQSVGCGARRERPARRIAIDGADVVWRKSLRRAVLEWIVVRVRERAARRFRSSVVQRVVRVQRQ